MVADSIELVESSLTLLSKLLLELLGDTEVLRSLFGDGVISLLLLSLVEVFILGGILLRRTCFITARRDTKFDFSFSRTPSEFELSFDADFDTMIVSEDAILFVYFFSGDIDFDWDDSTSWLPFDSTTYCSDVLSVFTAEPYFNFSPASSSCKLAL